MRKANPIEKLIINRCILIAKRQALEEIEKALEGIEKNPHIELLDVFNSGITVDLKKAKSRALSILKERIERV